MSQETNGNAAAYFVDRHVAEGRRAKAAFVEAGGDRSLSYGDFADKSDRMAELFTRHGLVREDRVAMLVLDVVEFPIIFWGSLKAGVIPIPLNTLLTTDGYKYIFSDSRAKALFISPPLLPLVEPILHELPDLRHVFVVGGTGDRHLDFGAELEASGPRNLVTLSPDETAFWLYSSGSTGMPKGVCHVHGSLRATADTYASNVLGITERDTAFSAAKLFFAYGLGNGMTFPLSVGATTALLPGRPTPEAVLEVFSEVGPTIFFGVPTLYASLLAAMDGTRPKGADRLRLCVSAGEALPKDVGQQWRDLLGVDVLDGVGSTEMLHIFLSNAPEDVAYGTSGRAVPGYEVRLIDEEGQPVPDGEIGELLVKGASAANCYWNQRHKSRATFEGVWTRTGDKYYRSEDGHYIFCGRTDDMLKVSGIWVSPFEVEQALVSHPAVLEAAVVGQADENDLVKPKAFVVLKGDRDGATLDAELKEHVKAAIGNWKYPRWIEFVDELPKTGTGKIQRFKLRGPT
ncbi:MAG: benzoate-CoA ligase family protein [Proteobacteria bacterium]|nr:benzoate-CoA ligase family protein [Pseudomonadota bacterium]